MRVCAEFWIFTSYLAVIILCRYSVICQLNTDVLWDSCNTTICGPHNLNIQCNSDSKILINNVTSGLGHAFDEISYLNLRRMCMGMSKCDPSHMGFCNQHRGARFNVSYTCIKEQTIDNVCDSKGQVLTGNSGFITNPSYPAETSYRSCKWKILVPENHFVHLFLHEVLPSGSTDDFCSDGGLVFNTDKPCRAGFPTYRICSEAKINSTIIACSNTEIWLPSSEKNMRFLLSYYVVRVPELRYVSLYNMDITCHVLPKETFIYRVQEGFPTNVTDSPITNETVIFNTAKTKKDNGIDYVAYIGLAVGVLVIIIIVIIVAIYLRYRYMNRSETSETKADQSSSVSQSNGTDIQKRPLPETQNNEAPKPGGQAVLQQDYSVVADEIARQPPHKHNQDLSSYTYSSPTYAEIEECSPTGKKPKAPLSTKRSIDNSKRKLPAKPDENPTSSIYSEIEDDEAKDRGTEKLVISKNNKNQEKVVPEYAFKKKFSEASNIYAECEDIKKPDDERPYIDMTHKKADESEYVPHIKSAKDKENLSKRSRVPDKSKAENIPYADCDVKAKIAGIEKNVKRSVKDSVTSESDSDDEICIVENELYEPFESAKV